jgi:hypothetical protein
MIQRLCVALHGTLGSYLRDALHEGSADAMACLHVPRVMVCGVFFLLFPYLVACSIISVFKSYSSICKLNRDRVQRPVAQSLKQLQKAR